MTPVNYLSVSKNRNWYVCKIKKFPLTHWGRVTHIWVSKLIIIGSDNGLSHSRRQAIIWTNAGILLIRTLGTNFSGILGEIHLFSFSKIHLKMSSAKWRLFGIGLNESIGERSFSNPNPSSRTIHIRDPHLKNTCLRGSLWKVKYAWGDMRHM